MKLVIVESPAKSRTISRFLGSEYTVKASLGHVRDLPTKELGIDIANSFTPRYVIISQRKHVVSELKKSAENASAVYLATDPDREGEAISWHLVKALKLDNNGKPIHRVVFHEITREAVEEAFRQPRSIDMNLVNAQQARRLLDRLVGYMLSPLLWRKVQRGLSAGRVQSAALRMIVDREREIQSFVPTEYWLIEAELAKMPPEDASPSFKALLVGFSDGTKIEIPDRGKAEALQSELRAAEYYVKSVQVKEALRQPAPPFITSTLQQEAWRKLRFTAQRTMSVAQQLYEGIPIGDEGPVGLITYMRTDSTHVASSALAETRQFIKERFGVQYLPPHARTFEKAKKAKWTQEAHEAIRPTRVHREPENLRPFLTPDQFKLYELIWKRMVASQMTAAVLDVVTLEVEARKKKADRGYLLRTTSYVVKFPGFLILYSEDRDEDTGEDTATLPLPKLSPGEPLKLLDLIPQQCFTQPPPRYTEATLIKALEQKGIGRPSTYAPIIATIQERGYVYKENGRFRPDEIGMVVSDLLTKHFPKIVKLDFTARMEEELDDIARGKKQWVSVVKEFYEPFEKMVTQAQTNIDRIKVIKPTEEKCPDCGSPMVVRIGRYGKFLACSNYPECKKTMPFLTRTGVSCPRPGCDGEIVEKIGKRKRRFYACTKYPECNFTLNRKPIPQSCPDCGNILITWRRNLVKCIACDYKGELDAIEKVGTKV